MRDDRKRAVAFNVMQNAVVRTASLRTVRFIAGGDQKTAVLCTSTSTHTNACYILEYEYHYEYRTERIMYGYYERWYKYSYEHPLHMKYSYS
eukprot:scaffold598330_cov28-Prasinocladus_malaysianus.AAC.1